MASQYIEKDNLNLSAFLFFCIRNGSRWPQSFFFPTTSYESFINPTDFNIFLAVNRMALTSAKMVIDTRMALFDE